MTRERQLYMCLAHKAGWRYQRRTLLRHFAKRGPKGQASMTVCIAGPILLINDGTSLMPVSESVQAEMREEWISDLMKL